MISDSGVLGGGLELAKVEVASSNLVSRSNSKLINFNLLSAAFVTQLIKNAPHPAKSSSKRRARVGWFGSI